MTHAPDSLWPVASALVVLVAGAFLAEHWAAGLDPDARTITVLGHETAISDDDDDLPRTSESLEQPINTRHMEARRAVLRGDALAATKMLKELAAEHPEHPELYEELGEQLLATGKVKEAVGAFEQGRTLAPKQAWPYLGLGRAKRKLDDLDGAEAAFRAALEREPSSGVARRALGSVLQKRGKAAAAIPILDVATRHGSNEEVARAFALLGAAYLATGERARAALCFDEAILRAPAVAELRVRIAQAYLATGEEADLERAHSDLEQAVRLAPESPAVWSALARALEGMGQKQAAVDAYAKALALDPTYTYVRRRLLRLALDVGNFDLARMHAEHLLREDSDEPEHHFLAGLVATAAGELDEGRRHYRDAIAKAGGSYPEASFNLGLLERKAGNRTAAAAAYRDAIAARPNYVAAMNNLALLLTAEKKDKEAEALYLQAVKINPSYRSAWLNLGAMRSDRGDYKGAIEAYERVLAKDPGYIKARLNLGVALARSGAIEKAIAAYREVLRSQPRYTSAWYNLGLALEQAQHSQEALDAFRQAHTLDAEHVASLKHLAALEASQGDIATARTAYEELALRLPADADVRLALADVQQRAGDLAACQGSLRLLASGEAQARAQHLKRLCSGSSSSATKESR